MSDPWLPQLSLIGVERKRVKSLAGFRQGHRVPTEKTNATDAFVGRIAERDLQNDLEIRFARLREAFDFKRRDLSKTGPTSGQGSLLTEAFEYIVSASVLEDAPASCVIERRVTNVSSLDVLLDGPFDRVFATLLETVEIPAPLPIDVELVIDTIEEADPSDLVLDYNADGTECRVQPRDSQTRIVITSDAVTVHDTQALPSALLATAQQFLSRFVDLGGGGQLGE